MAWPTIGMALLRFLRAFEVLFWSATASMYPNSCPSISATPSHGSSATFARPLGEIVNHLREFPGEQTSEAAIEEMRNRARLCVTAVNDDLQKRDYIVGNTFSAADIMLGYTIMLTLKFLPEAAPPAVAEYWDRLQQRPAYESAFGNAG